MTPTNCFSFYDFMFLVICPFEFYDNFDEVCQTKNRLCKLLFHFLNFVKLSQFDGFAIPSNI
jgi:hypothetical protein